MKNSKKILAAALVLVLLGGGGAVYAATTASNLDVLADATGKSVEAIVEDREEGETLGSIAAEAGKLEEFKAGMLENRKAVIAQRVEEGRLTQEEADEFLATMEEHMADCDGTGTGMNLGQESGLGFGQQNQNKGGNQSGTQAGSGFGNGMRNGR